jgi:putative peptide zinc metalloprotease protein
MSAEPEPLRPRLASDVQVATLPPDEGPARNVIRRPGLPQACIRVTDEIAELILALDGSRRVESIAEDTHGHFGPDGPALLVRVLAELAERGFLDGIAADDPRRQVHMGWFARLARPRTWRWRRAPGAIERTYRFGGWLAVTRPAFVASCAIALAGLAATVLLLIRGGVTPLVVGGRLELGAACFFAGRVALVAIHELAHGLALARVGHQVGGAGIKLFAIFPYAFVDTSPVWLEPRRRRVAVTLAGPISDLMFGGVAAIAALLTVGTIREVCFQLCLAGYLAALLNLNPCLERDGYHLLSDGLRRPGLRRAAVLDLQMRLAGRGARDSARPLRWYSLAIVVWGVVGAGLAVASLSGSLPVLRAAVPHDISAPLVGALWLVLLAPTALLIGRPLVMRVSSSSAPPVPPRPPQPLATARARRADLHVPICSSERVMPLVRGVLTDTSLRRRIWSLGAPPGLQVLGDRELRSSVTGVIFAAGAESLALAHAVGALGPVIARTTDHVIDDTNFGQLKAYLGLDSPPQEPALRAEPDFSYQPPPVPALTPPLYVPPVHHHAAASFDSPLVTSWAGSVPAWPGNNAGPVVIAHWMAAGAAAAGLPGPLPVMAALVESNLNNNACCDHDSLGYFQMREGIWNNGLYAGYYDHPELQLEWFIHQALIVRDEAIVAGDATFGQDPSTWGTWVANIENPAAEYRYRYGEQLANAEALLSTPMHGALFGAGAWVSDGSSAFLRSPNTSVPNVGEPSFNAKAAGVPTDHEPGFVAAPGVGSGASIGNSGVPESGGSAIAGYVNPLPGAVPSRVDQGVDYTLSSEGFLAPAQSVIIEADANNPGWAGGGYVAAEIMSGPMAGHVYYVAEGVTPAVAVGDVVSEGTPIATPVASPYNGIVGNIEAGWADPNVPGRPLAQSLEGYAGDQSLQGLEAGWSWNMFATSLGAPTGTFDGAGAGLAAEAMALAPSVIEPTAGAGSVVQLPGGGTVPTAGVPSVVPAPAAAGVATAPSPSGGVSLTDEPVQTAAPAAAGDVAATTVGVPVHDTVALDPRSGPTPQPAPPVEPGFSAASSATVATTPPAEPGFSAASATTVATSPPSEPTFNAK